jgi:glycosyltransferase involved in cell wall biosynthesis
MANKLAIIVQRYGLEINGGAEYHARLIAEKLAKYFAIEVFTSTALDYITWDHHFDEGQDIVNSIPVNRFKVEHPRDPETFGRIQELVFEREHSHDDELEWLKEEGPYIPQALAALKKRNREFDYFIFFSYRYYHSYYGIKEFREKSILVPTAEHDDVLYLKIFKDFFNQPAAFIYNSHEEKQIINNVSDNEKVLGDIVGVGSEIPDTFDPESFRKKFNIQGNFFVYIGRLDENKGVPQLLNYFNRLLVENDMEISLVLMGKSLIEIPHHPRIRYLGFVSDQEKFDALKGADFLIIPSQFESLSMVTLEAWALGKPVIANGNTEVLQGQCRRSNAGLWYTSYDEFREVMMLMVKDEKLRTRMGTNGRAFFTAHYSWPVIEKKYLDVIAKLDQR